MSIRAFKGHVPQIDDTCYVDESAEVIGQVILGKNVSLWPKVVLRGDVNTIEIGEGSNVQDHTVCHVTHSASFNPGGCPLVVGKWVTVGHRALLHGCTIRDECLIGMGAIVMDNAVIESQVLLGAGSLVPPGKRLRSGYLYMGNPAREVRVLNKDEIDFIHYSAEHYVALKEQYRVSS